MIQPPEPPPGWFDGPLGALRGAAILFSAALLGLAAATIVNALADFTHGQERSRP